MTRKFTKSIFSEDVMSFTFSLSKLLARIDEAFEVVGALRLNQLNSKYTCMQNLEGDLEDIRRDIYVALGGSEKTFEVYERYSCKYCGKPLDSSEGHLTCGISRSFDTR